MERKKGNTFFYISLPLLKYMVYLKWNVIRREKKRTESEMRSEMWIFHSFPFFCKEMHLGNRSAVKLSEDAERSSAYNEELP